MLKNFIWAVGVRPSLYFGCTQAVLRINAQALRGFRNRKGVPWERLEFRCRRTSAYDVILGHRANSYPIPHYANYGSVNLTLSRGLAPCMCVVPQSPILMKQDIQLDSRDTSNFPWELPN